MPVSKSMRDLIQNDIGRLRSAIKSKHISVHKELYDSILQTYDSVIPNLREGLETIEKEVEVVSSFRKGGGVQATRLNGDLLRTNLSKLSNKLQNYLDDDGETSVISEPVAPAATRVAPKREEPKKSHQPPVSLSSDQAEILSNIDLAINTVRKRQDLTPNRRDEFMQVLNEIKTAIEHEPNKKERWKLIRPLLSWAYNQTDPSIASDILYLLSEAVR